MLAHRVRYHCDYAMGKYKYKCACVCVCVHICVFAGCALTEFATAMKEIADLKETMVNTKTGA